MHLFLCKSELNKKRYARKKLSGVKSRMLLSSITSSNLNQFESVLYALNAFLKDASDASFPL